jgi:predicted AAA+ superfamily ATPase
LLRLQKNTIASCKILCDDSTTGFKVKKVDYPKFYFFDIGAVRALANSLRDPMDSIQLGYRFETVVFHELNAARSYLNFGGQFSYWANNSGGEIDFIWSRGKYNIGIEVKASKTWKNKMGTHLKEFIKQIYKTNFP